MTHEKIVYDVLVQEALRGVIRQVLSIVSNSGLPGKHHFLITFRTNASGVEIPSHLKESYPERITIVLQHCFQDLQVEKDFFSVTLSFNYALERLVIPFSSIDFFSDPSAFFELSFKFLEENHSQTTRKDEPKYLLASLDNEENSLLKTITIPSSCREFSSKNGDKQMANANIVSLNAFRKS